MLGSWNRISNVFWKILLQNSSCFHNASEVGNEHHLFPKNNFNLVAIKLVEKTWEPVHLFAHISMASLLVKAKEEKGHWGNGSSTLLYLQESCLKKKIPGDWARRPADVGDLKITFWEIVPHNPHLFFHKNLLASNIRRWLKALESVLQECQWYSKSGVPTWIPRTMLMISLTSSLSNLHKGSLKCYPRCTHEVVVEDQRFVPGTLVGDRAWIENPVLCSFTLPVSQMRISWVTHYASSRPLPIEIPISGPRWSSR